MVYIFTSFMCAMLRFGLHLISLAYTRGLVMIRNTTDCTDGYVFSEDDWSADEKWVAQSRRRAQKRKELQRKHELYAHLLAAAAVLAIIIVLVFIWQAASGASGFGRAQNVGASVPDSGSFHDYDNETETSSCSVPMPDIDVQLLPVNGYSRPGDRLEEVNAIVIHYTGNPGTTAQQNRSYFASLAESGETSASSHFVIGIDGEIIQCVPCDEIAYASNDRNHDTLSIECCHTDESGEFTAATYQSLVELTAWLLCEYDLSTTDVIRHYDVTGKICPKYYVEHSDAWEEFLNDVEEALVF